MPTEFNRAFDSSADRHRFAVDEKTDSFDTTTRGIAETSHSESSNAVGSANGNKANSQTRAVYRATLDGELVRAKLHQRVLALVDHEFEKDSVTDSSTDTEGEEVDGKANQRRGLRERMDEIIREIFGLAALHPHHHVLEFVAVAYVPWNDVSEDCICLLSQRCFVLVFTGRELKDMQSNFDCLWHWSLPHGR